MNIPYDVVFDVATAPDPERDTYIGSGISAVIALFMAWVFARLPATRKREGRLFVPLGVCLMACFMAYDDYRTSVQDRDRLLGALHDGRARTVEGRIEHFHPAPVGGHGAESFDVGGRHYSYWEYVGTRGFHQVATSGGPLRDGLLVRLTDVEGVIVRVEIAR